MSKQIIFSGIQPSGNLHIGNYAGAIRQWVDLQKDDQNKLMFCVVDLHAITVPQDPDMLRSKNLELSALYIACGIDPEKSDIFVQSENPDHSYLTWVFNTMTPMGWLERMTQYKDKAKKQGERSSVGLFDYPVLMACDILLYDTDVVPVGDDQKQHIELARDIAEKFNQQFAEIFKLPEIMNRKETARIMSLQDPSSKMSKSDNNENATINILDTPDDIARKVKKAVTDSGKGVRYGEDKPAISNLLAIYSALTDKDIASLELEYADMGYGDFKNDLAEVIVGALEPIQKRYNQLMSDQTELNTILDRGAEKARSISSNKIAAVKEAVGLGR